MHPAEQAKSYRQKVFILQMVLWIVGTPLVLMSNKDKPPTDDVQFFVGLSLLCLAAVSFLLHPLITWWLKRQLDRKKASNPAAYTSTPPLTPLSPSQPPTFELSVVLVDEAPM